MTSFRGIFIFLNILLEVQLYNSNDGLLHGWLFVCVYLYYIYTYDGPRDDQVYCMAGSFSLREYSAAIMAGVTWAPTPETHTNRDMILRLIHTNRDMILRLIHANRDMILRLIHANRDMILQLIHANRDMILQLIHTNRDMIL